MVTERIDRALEALADCRAALPALRDVFRAESAERATLEALLAALAAAHAQLQSGQPSMEKAARPK